MRKVQFKSSGRTSVRIIRPSDFERADINPPKDDVVFDASNDFTAELTNDQGDFLLGLSDEFQDISKAEEPAPEAKPTTSTSSTKPKS